MKFVARTVTVIDVPIPFGTVIMRPEQIILRIGAHSVDIGSWCYLQREASPKLVKRRANEGRKVVVSSLCPYRKQKVLAFILFISRESEHGKRRESTLQAMVKKFGVFMYWSDQNGFHTMLDDSVCARAAAVAYATHVRERVMSFELAQNSGARLQTDTLALLGEFFEVEDFGKGINLLCRTTGSIDPTRPPCEKVYGRFLGLCESIFVGLSELVLDFRAYPFATTMPEHLGYPGNKMWVFPSRVWCLPTNRLTAHIAEAYGSGFDYATGGIATREQLMRPDMLTCDGTRSRKQVTRMLARAPELIRLANAAPRHPHRIFMATLAHNAFMPLFLSRTALSWAEAIDLPWTGDDSVTIGVLRQRFRTIKHRAGGKRPAYELPLNFMPEFRLFLRLRRFLVDGHPEFNRLFLTLGQNAAKPPAPLKTNLGITCRAFKRIDPELSPVLSRASRAAKSNWTIPNSDVATAAIILQNSEETVRRSYSAGSRSSHLSEMSSFLGQVSSLATNEITRNATAVGGCSSLGNPVAHPELSITVLPNCDSPEAGCLFCDKYRIHADEKDVRKLVSFEYCLLRTTHLAGLHSIGKGLLERIQSILDEVHSLDATIVSRIRTEVEDGEMDPFWAKKYDMLLRLRLIHDDC